MAVHDTQKILFAGLPRQRRLGAPVVVGLWLVLTVAFVTDAVPTQPSAEWLYDLEARRADYARSFEAERHAREAEHARAASRQARLPPGTARNLVVRPLATDVAGARDRAPTPCSFE